MTALGTPERDRQLLASLHWAMARTATRQARYARECLEAGVDEVPLQTINAHEEDMSECRHIVRVLAKA